MTNNGAPRRLGRIGGTVGGMARRDDRPMPSLAAADRAAVRARGSRSPGW